MARENFKIAGFQIVCEIFRPENNYMSLLLSRNFQLE